MWERQLEFGCVLGTREIELGRQGAATAAGGLFADFV